jgi:hypothetical protein
MICSAAGASSSSLKWWLGYPPREIIRRSGEYLREAGGIEFIEVIELVESNTLGLIALYRQWIVDPDGANLRAKGNEIGNEIGH